MQPNPRGENIDNHLFMRGMLKSLQKLLLGLRDLIANIFLKYTLPHNSTQRALKQLKGYCKGSISKLKCENKGEHGARWGWREKRPDHVGTDSPR